MDIKQLANDKYIPDIYSVYYACGLYGKVVRPISYDGLMGYTDGQGDREQYGIEPSILPGFVGEPRWDCLIRDNPLGTYVVSLRSQWAVDPLLLFVDDPKFSGSIYKLVSRSVLHWKAADKLGNLFP